MCQGLPLYPHRFRDLGLAADKGIVPTLKERALPGSGEAIAGKHLEIRDRFRGQVSFFCPVENGPGQGMFALLLQGKCQAQKFLFLDTGSWDQICDLGLSRGDGAGFIQNDNLRFSGVFQGYSVLKKNAVLGAHSVAHHNGHRGGKAQSTRAGDHQHRDSAGQSKTDFLPQKQPDNGGKNGNGDDCRDKDARDFIRNLGNGRLGGRSITDHLNDLRKCGVLPHPSCLAGQKS